MATVRVSFLLGGERFHGRLNRSSVLSDVPPEATRVDRAGPGYKVIRLRGLSHTDNMARIRQYFHVPTDEGPDLRSNKLLAELPPQDLQFLIPHFVTMKLAQGTILCEPGVDVDHVYFPM